MSLSFFPDLIIAAPIIAVIFITALSIYRVCFHHSNNVTLEFPCSEREREKERGRERNTSQGIWRKQPEIRASASWILKSFDVKEATTTGMLRCCPANAPLLRLDFSPPNSSPPSPQMKRVQLGPNF